MGLFGNPLSYAGYPPGVTGTPQTQNTTVRAATLAEANAGVLDNVYISPSTQAAAVAVDFASPPALGFGSTTPRPVHATTLASSGDSNIATGAGAKIGFFGATAITQPTNTTDLRTLLINLGLLATGGASPLNLNGGTLTAAEVDATTITTNVAAAEISMSGNTIAATGSNTDVSMNLTTKNAGSIIFSQSKAGIDQNMQITNSDNTAAAGNAGLQLAVGGATSTGDPYVSFQISGVGASTMTMGLDNSDSDIFKISNSATLGTSDAFKLTQAGALTTTSSITATAGDITATNGNIIVNHAANQFQCKGGAVTDFIGQATLALGTIDVANTNIAAGDRIIVTRSAKNGSTAYGTFLTTITPSTKFNITACKADTTTETGDTSIVDYVIIRQL